VLEEACICLVLVLFLLLDVFLNLRLYLNYVSFCFLFSVRCSHLTLINLKFMLKKIGYCYLVFYFMECFCWCDGNLLFFGRRWPDNSTALCPLLISYPCFTFMILKNDYYQLDAKGLSKIIHLFPRDNGKVFIYSILPTLHL